MSYNLKPPYGGYGRERVKNHYMPYHPMWLSFMPYEAVYWSNEYLHRLLHDSYIILYIKTL